MTPKQKADWIAALRSGKYKQGQGYLHLPGSNTYCCLGVAQKSCALKSISPFSIACLVVSSKGQLTREPTFLPEEIQLVLTEMNDDKKLSFTEIADYIETNIPADEPDAETES